MIAMSSLTREMLEAAFDAIEKMPGKITCQLDGWEAVTTEPPFLCVTCNTVTHRHKKHVNGIMSPRCWHCWQRWIEKSISRKLENF